MRFLIYFSAFYLLFTSFKVKAEENTQWLNYVFNKNQPGFQNVNNDYSYGNSFTIDYPAVDTLERNILGNVYADQNIYSRLDRLEKTVFGGTMTASLNERVEKLEKATSKTNNYTANNNVLFGSGFSQNNSRTYTGSNYNQYSTNNSNYDPMYSVLMYELEKEFLNTSYPSDPLEVRLTRLEQKIFSQSSESYPVSERVQRLAAYAEAKDSSSYYDEQQDLQDMNNMTKGMKALSVLFMILQLFL